MFDFTPQSFHTSYHRLLWYGLAFQAGAINAGGFLISHSFVSHVTGMGTMVGIELGRQNVWRALELLIVPLSFLVGATVSAFLIERPRALGNLPKYPIVMGIMCLLMNGVLTFGLLGCFGTAGEDIIDFRDMILISVLSFVCGMQNSAIVSATRGAIRTTHLTGIITDLGISLVKIKHFKNSPQERMKETIINQTRIMTFLAFSTGSALSAILFSEFHFFSFMIPALTSSLFFIITLVFTYSKTIATNLLEEKEFPRRAELT